MLASRTPDTDGMTFEAAPFPLPAPSRCRRPAHRCAAGRRAAPRRTGSSPRTAPARSSHPVKAKIASGIFHVPGGVSYDRTRRRPLLRRCRRRRVRRPATRPSAERRPLAAVPASPTREDPMHNLWNDFKKFIMQGDLVAIAVAFILGLAFKHGRRQRRERHRHTRSSVRSSARRPSTTSPSTSATA